MGSCPRDRLERGSPLAWMLGLGVSIATAMSRSARLRRGRCPVASGRTRRSVATAWRHRALSAHAQGCVRPGGFGGCARGVFGSESRWTGACSRREMARKWEGAAASASTRTASVTASGIGATGATGSATTMARSGRYRSRPSTGRLHRPLDGLAARKATRRRNPRTWSGESGPGERGKWLRGEGFAVEDGPALEGTGAERRNRKSSRSHRRICSLAAEKFRARFAATKNLFGSPSGDAT